MLSARKRTVAGGVELRGGQRSCEEHQAQSHSSIGAGDQFDFVIIDESTQAHESVLDCNAEG